MRIALYARKSSESVDRQVQSLEDQLNVLQELAGRERLNVVEVIQESKSAKAPGTRPEFGRMLQLIEEGKIDGILTWSINRLARNPVDGGMIAYMLQTGKLQMIRTVDRTYLPEDNALILSIETGMATSYLQDLNRNVSRGMVSKIERGWHTNKAPIGYLNNPITREIDTDPDRIELVRMAWSKLLSGDYSVCKIYRELVDAGLTIKTNRRKPVAPSRAAIYAMFKNPFYCGQLRFRGKIHIGRHQPVITPIEFKRAQDIIRVSSGVVRKKLDDPFPFNRVFKCADCGCAILGERKRKFYPQTGRFVEYVYYHCSGAKGCSRQSIRQEYITQALERLVESVKIPASFAGWLKQALADGLSQKHIEADSVLETTEAHIEQLQRNQRRLTMMRLSGELNEPDYRQMRSDVEKEIQRAEEGMLELHQTRSRIIQRGHALIDAAVAANELPADGSFLSVLGGVARRLGAHRFTQGRLLIEPDAVITKIAGFEPAESDFRRPKHGENLPMISSWWTIVDDILTLMVDADLQQTETPTQSEHE